MTTAIPSSQAIQYLDHDIKFLKSDSETAYLLPKFTNKAQFFSKIAQVYLHTKATAFKTELLSTFKSKNPTYIIDLKNLPLEAVHQYTYIQNKFNDYIKKGLDLKFKLPINAQYQDSDFEAASQLYLIYKASTGQFSVRAPSEAPEFTQLFSHDASPLGEKRQKAEQILGVCYEVLMNVVNVIF